MATEVVIPMLGITVERGTIIEWLKSEGDLVEKGEIIFIVETEKVSTEVESPASGILAKIIIPVGVEVPVLTLAAVITEPGEELPEEYANRGIDSSLTEAEAKVQSEKEPVSTIAAQTLAPPTGSIKAVPAARKLAQDKGVDLKTVSGTGPGGIIVISDVEDAVMGKAKSSAKASTIARRIAEKDGIELEGIKGTGVRGRIMRADVEKWVKEDAEPRLGKIIPMDTMRRIIARRMADSSVTAPHIYFFTDVWMEPLLEFRRSILPDFEKKFNIRPSINDFLIKAVAMNIVNFPLLNATVKDQEIHILPDINMGLAVALSNGLIVPAIAHADKIGLVEVVRQRMDLVQRAQLGRLSIDEIERGTFTISSLSQYDINCFTAILNPPQSGILTLAKTRKELTMVNGKVKEKDIATFGLSVDHRIIDGAVAADFLQNLKWKLERPTFTFLTI